MHWLPVDKRIIYKPWGPDEIASDEIASDEIAPTVLSKWLRNCFFKCLLFPLIYVLVQGKQSIATTVVYKLFDQLRKELESVEINIVEGSEGRKLQRRSGLR